MASLPAVSAAPRTSDVVDAVRRGAPSKAAGSRGAPTLLEHLFASLALAALCAGAASADRVHVRAPALATWLETLAAFGTGCLLNGVLAATA